MVQGTRSKDRGHLEYEGPRRTSVDMFVDNSQVNLWRILLISSVAAIIQVVSSEEQRWNR